MVASLTVIDPVATYNKRIFKRVYFTDAMAKKVKDSLEEIIKKKKGERMFLDYSTHYTSNYNKSQANLMAAYSGFNHYGVIDTTLPVTDKSGIGYVYSKMCEQTQNNMYPKTYYRVKTSKYSQGTAAQRIQKGYRNKYGKPYAVNKKPTYKKKYTKNGINYTSWGSNNNSM